MKIGIILTPDVRSKAYLQKILQNNISLEQIIFMNDNRQEKQYTNDIIEKSIKAGFDISIPVSESLKNAGLNYREFNFVDINHEQLVDFISKTEIDIYIFSGGGILKNEILDSGPKFLHLHPGLVPHYRGSTCFYYSIINEGKCGVTAYFMDKTLDTGDVVFQKNFPKPDNIYVDDIFDAHIRSETLIEILKNQMMMGN